MITNKFMANGFEFVRYSSHVDCFSSTRWWYDWISKIRVVTKNIIYVKFEWKSKEIELMKSFFYVKSHSWDKMIDISLLILRLRFSSSTWWNSQRQRIFFFVSFSFLFRYTFINNEKIFKSSQKLLSTEWKIDALLRK